MRYYVWCRSDEPGIGEYILAEVVRDPMDTDREASLAAAIAGSRAVISTRLELSQTPEGRAALEAWDMRDDNAFNLETEFLLRGLRTRRGVHLRVVGRDEPEAVRGSSRLPRDPVRRDLVLKARALRALTRALVAESRARRVELDELADRGPTKVAGDDG